MLSVWGPSDQAGRQEPGEHQELVAERRAEGGVSWGKTLRRGMRLYACDFEGFL